MTDPTPEPWWPPHAIRRHVQEPAPDAAPADPPTWPEDAVAEVERLRDDLLYAAQQADRFRRRAERAESEVERLRHYRSLPVGMVWQDYYSPDDVTQIRDDAEARAERAESNARGKQAVIEAQRATLDRVRALADEWERERRACERRGVGGGPSSVARKNRVMRRVYERVLDDLIVILGVDPAPEAPALAEHEQCRRCGGPNVAWAAPSPLWNYVIRGNDINGESKFDDLVCMTCFVVLAAEAGLPAHGWRLTAHPEPEGLIYETPTGRTWDGEAFLWTEATS